MALSTTLELIMEKDKKDSTLDMMRRVLAEEKASGVMDEYMKRLRMYLHQPTKVLEETQRLEKPLSEQLTCLKNSMLHDNKMSSRSLKHWTNGAAFHLQMVIHTARLEMQGTAEHEAKLQGHLASITTLLECYERQLQELLKQYKNYKKSTISIKPNIVWNQLVCSLDGVIFMQDWVVKDEEFKRESPSLMSSLFPMTNSSNDYVDYMFDNWAQLKKLKSYFSDLKGKIKDLILLNDEFKIQKVLPV